MLLGNAALNHIFYIAFSENSTLKLNDTHLRIIICMHTRIENMHTISSWWHWWLVIHTVWHISFKKQ